MPKNISDSERRPQAHSANSAQERRIYPRWRMGGWFFKHLPTGRVFSVSNLSQGGVGLEIINEDDWHLFAAGTRFTGMLKMGENQIRIALKVVHLGTSWMGAQFEDLSGDSKKWIFGFLEPEELGKALRPVPMVGKNGTTSHSLWFHAQAGVELWIHFQPASNQIQSWVLTFLGHWVEWSLGIGHFKSAEATWDIGHSGIESQAIGQSCWDLRFDQTPDPVKLELAKRILISSNLEKTIKSKLLQCFKDGLA